MAPTHRWALTTEDQIVMEPGPNEGDGMVPTLDENGQTIQQTLRHIPVHDLGPFGTPPPTAEEPNPPSLNCSKCGAKHWAAERTGPASTDDGSFTLCCQKGHVDLRPLLTHSQLPAQLRQLMLMPAFQRALRIYNNMFAMVSASTNMAMLPGLSEVRINGALHHRVGPVRPNPGYRPSYAQWYGIDPSDEAAYVENRMRAIGGGGQGPGGRARRDNYGVRAAVVGALDDMMRQRCPYARSFMHADQIQRQHEAREAQLAARDHRPVRPITNIQVNIAGAGPNIGVPTIGRFVNPRATAAGAAAAAGATESIHPGRLNRPTIGAQGEVAMINPEGQVSESDDHLTATGE